MGVSSSIRFRYVVIVLFAFVLAAPAGSYASHVRIIRLSLVQGDVRILHDSKGDPLANDKAPWERAELNLPIRQHDVVATDNGRAEVEFENGAMAFLNENSVLEFFDLSLEDGSFTTRLVLRQGTASFYVNPGSEDYFSVTGGDFTTEVSTRANFRMDNFDDGSTVAVSKGRVVVARKGGSKELSKGQSLSMRADDEESAAVGRAADMDEFDRWVSGREDSVVTATNAAMQYSNGSSYTSGFADLYNYGSFYPVAGYGYGWQPYGVGFGWSPFDYGNWFYGAGLGWGFIGSQPWGWLPYHYGGWIFQPGTGWLWTPTGFTNGKGQPQPVKFHPVTATFVRSGDQVGIVPVHPLDTHGKILNTAQGVMPLNAKSAATSSATASAGNWKATKEPPANTIISHVAAASVPARVTRSVDASLAAVKASQPNVRSSSIVYDAKEHRFVNGNGPSTEERSSSSAARQAIPATSDASATAKTASASSRAETPASARTAAPSTSASARVTPPPPAPRSGAFRGGFSEGGAAARGGVATGSSTPRSSAPVAHTSTGSSAGSVHSH
jgi:uncharacterized protein DUF6600/FecR-like protein